MKGEGTVTVAVCEPGQDVGGVKRQRHVKIDYVEMTQSNLSKKGMHFPLARWPDPSALPASA